MQHLYDFGGERGHSAAGLIVTSALMIWKTLILVTGSESPVRAVSFVWFY